MAWVEETAITTVVTQITYSGDYPTAALVDGAHAGFDLLVRAHFWSPAAVNGALTLQADWLPATTAPASLPAGDANATVSVHVPASAVNLWWPNGLGKHPLYDLDISFGPAEGRGRGVPLAAKKARPLAAKKARAGALAATQTVRARRRVGFRQFALVTGNDTDPAYVASAVGQEGTAGHGMYFRVNGVAIWARGANVIPMEMNEGRFDATAYGRMVASAADANMNTLRVWGGGVFAPEPFYEAADAHGMLVMQDMMYAQLGHSPTEGDPTQDAELRHQVGRLSQHASIVMYDGCNECQVIMGTATEVYATFVMRVVAETDPSRVVWPSCPAVGWTAGVDRLTSLPTGTPLATPKTGNEIEHHGPYQHGGTWPAVNGCPADTVTVGMPLPLDDLKGQPTGLEYPNVFASEFGVSSFSSFESMAPTLAPAHWAVHGGAPPDVCSGDENCADRFACTGGNVMAERNYACDNLMKAYLGADLDLDSVGTEPFQQQLYGCLLSAGLHLKTDIETRRAQNQFGTIVWQLNEIWPTGGWGSLEYGNPHYPGQVVGGRWKLMHHWLEQSVFRDVQAAVGANGVAYVANDAPQPLANAVFSLLAVNVADGSETSLLVADVNLPAGPGAKAWYTVPDYAALDVNATLLVATVTTAEGEVASTNEVALVPPGNLAVNRAVTVKVTVGAVDRRGNSAQVFVEATGGVAAYVTLTTLAHGRFSRNGFLLKDGAQEALAFLGFEGFDPVVLRESVRADHLAGALGVLGAR